MRHYRPSNDEEKLYGSIVSVTNKWFALNLQFIGWDNEHFYFASEVYGHVYRIKFRTGEVEMAEFCWNFINHKFEAEHEFKHWGDVTKEDATECAVELGARIPQIAKIISK